MMFRRRQFLHLAAGAVVLPAMPVAAQAQAFPSHPITMIVPVSAGGAMDMLARIVAQGMSASLGQPVIIENVTGASGAIGVGRVARATPDGYTLSYAAFATHVVSAATMTLPYDVIADFEPVALISATPWLIAAKNNLPANDLKSLVPYRGTAPVIPDLVSGQIDMSILDPVTCLPQFRAGSIKVFAVMAKSRTANAPEVPTVDEAGAAGLHMAPWQAIWAPKGTPKDIIARLNGAIVKTL